MGRNLWQLLPFSPSPAGSQVPRGSQLAVTQLEGTPESPHFWFLVFWRS